MAKTYRNFEDADVVCPFYQGISGDGRTIRCEGMFFGSHTCTRFGSIRLRKKHMNDYCNGFRCDQCALHRALDQKYPRVG